MASNPLSVPITAGTPEPYTAGIGVQTPKLSGSPIAAPSNISEILALLNGTAETITRTAEIVTRTNEIRVQSERRTKQEAEDADRSDLHLLQKEADLWKTMAENDPIVLHSKAYEDFLDKLKGETEKSDRSPFYQAQAASYLANSTAFKQNTLYTQEARAEAAANRQEAADNRKEAAADRQEAAADRAANRQEAEIEKAQAEMARRGRQLGITVTSDIEVKIAEAEANGVPATQISKMIDAWGIERGADEVPEVKTAVHLLRNTFDTRKLNELKAAIKESAKNQFVDDAGDLQGIPLTMFNEQIDDPEQRSKAVTQVGHSVSALVDPLISSQDHSAAGLAATFSKLDDLEAGVKSVPYQTASQQDFTNRVLSITSDAREKVLQNFGNDIVAQTVANVNNTRRNEDVPQEDVPKFVAAVINEQLGIDAVFYNKDAGYTSSIPEFKAMMPRLDALTERINDEMNKDAPAREAMQRLIGTVKLQSINKGANFSMVPPKLHEIQPMAIVDDATLKLAKFNPDTVPIDTLRYVVSRYPKGTDLGYFKATVENFVSNPLLPNGQVNQDGFERTMVILNGTQYGRSIAIQGYDGLSEPKAIRLIKTAIWGNLRRIATSGDPVDAHDAKIAKGLIGNSEDKNSFQSYMAFMDAPQNPAGSAKTNSSELTFSDTLEKVYDRRLVASPALKDIIQAIDMAAMQDNPVYKDNYLLQRETHKVALQALGISMVDTGTTTRAVRDTYGHVPSNPQKTLDAVLAIKPDWASPMHRSTLKEVLNREPTMIELNETKGWNMDRLLHYGGPNRLTGSKLTIGNYSNIPEKSMIDENEFFLSGEKNPDYGKGELFKTTPLSYTRNKEGKIRVTGFSNQNYREIFSWGVGVTGSERMDEHFYINSTIESMVDNLIEQDDYQNR